MEEFQIVGDTTYTVNNLSLETNYFWQVSAKDELNESVSSEISSFTTFSAQNNPFLFIKRIDGNSVIFLEQILMRLMKPLMQMFYSLQMNLKIVFDQSEITTSVKLHF